MFLRSRRLFKKVLRIIFLHSLTIHYVVSKKVTLKWLDDSENSFAKLKTKLITLPIFTLPWVSMCYVVYFDALKVRLSCVL